MLEKGEFVVRKEVAKKYLPELEELNRGGNDVRSKIARATTGLFSQTDGQIDIFFVKFDGVISKESVFDLEFPSRFSFGGRHGVNIIYLAVFGNYVTDTLESIFNPAANPSAVRRVCGNVDDRLSVRRHCRSW